MTTYSERSGINLAFFVIALNHYFIDKIHGIFPASVPELLCNAETVASLARAGYFLI